MNDPRKTNPVLRYYEAEMRYLRQASEEYVRAYPEAAQRLGLTRLGAGDDSVEQLFQGFAFLMGHLRQTLDDELPEITEPLTSTMWPHMMRTIPSLAILECVPRAGQPPAGMLPAGVAVRSAPLGPLQTVCIYRTTQPVRVLPLRLREAGAQVRPDGSSALRLAFDLLRFDRRDLGDMSRIRLYLHGDRPTASALYAAFTRHVQSIDMRIPSRHDGRAQPQPKMKIEAAGFGPGTRLWPGDDPGQGPQMDGDQGLLEYFTFPEKYHFIDLCGFDAASLPAEATQVEFEIVLQQHLASDVTFGATNVRLNCTPIINLFELDAMPIRTDAHQREYRIATPPSAGPHIEAYEAMSVTAIDHKTADKHEYMAFSSFKHRGGMSHHEAPERYFHTYSVRGPSGAREMWLTLGGQAWDLPGSVLDDHITARVTACNGMLPRMAVRAATLTEPVSALPGIESVRNLTQPTMPVYPPEGERYQWKVMSHFAPNNLALLDARIMREMLALYDWTDDEANRRRIDAIIGLRHRPLQHLVRNGLRRGVEIEITLDPGGFMGAGDLTLFGDVLNRFIGRYASTQHFVQLVLWFGELSPEGISHRKRTEYPRIEYSGPLL